MISARYYRFTLVAILFAVSACSARSVPSLAGGNGGTGGSAGSAGGSAGGAGGVGGGPCTKCACKLDCTVAEATAGVECCEGVCTTPCVSTVDGCYNPDVKQFCATLADGGTGAGGGASSSSGAGGGAPAAAIECAPSIGSQQCPAGYAYYTTVNSSMGCGALHCTTSAPQNVCYANAATVRGACDLATACAGGLQLIAELAVCGCSDNTYYVCAK